MSKKVGFSDNSMKTLLTGQGDVGTKAENAVFMHLLRADIKSGYYAESERDVDFVSGIPKSPVVIEVKYASDIKWRDKKFAGTRLFLKRYPGAKKVLIITKDCSFHIKHDQTLIQAIPLWQFLSNDFPR